MKRQFTTADTLRPGDTFVRRVAGVESLWTVKEVTEIESLEVPSVKVTTVDGPTFYFREDKTVEVLA